MSLEQYISNINAAYKHRKATEYTYRSDLAKLIETLVPESIVPLYLYSETNGQFSTEQITTPPDEHHSKSKFRKPNFNTEILNKIASNLGLKFVSEKEQEGNVCMANNKEVRPEYRQNFALIDILDYIYAVLHSSSYREKHKESPEIGSPIIPYPRDSKTFWELVELGSQIRQIHLLKSATIEDYISKFNIEGDCVVTKPRFENSQLQEEITSVENSPPLDGNSKKNPLGRLYINETQYFENVHEVVWNFYIGGYQPAQKWLKDRKDKKLKFADIAHYQKIIISLTKTDRLVKKIDSIEIE